MSKNFSTRVVHAGEERTKPHHAITTPIYQTSTYTFKNTQELVDFMEASLWGEDTGRDEYGRYGNPTIATVEAKLAELDSGESACLFSSGMAAITTTSACFQPVAALLLLMIAIDAPASL